MESKYVVIFFAIINYSSCAGMLRRTPKVYNALITTDENLTPSRAFPVIQPTIHETGIAHYPYGPFNPYRFYSPPIVHLGPQGFGPHQGLPFIPQQLPPYGSNQISQGPPPSLQGHFSFSSPQAQLPPGPNQEQSFPPDFLPQNQFQHQQPSQLQQNYGPESKQDQLPVIPSIGDKQQMSRPEQPPVPLNEFGLPPSLIPLHSYQHPQQPRPDIPPSLQPYPFNNYPLIYDQFNQFHPQDHYLPPYGYYPTHPFVQQNPLRPHQKKPKKPSPTPKPSKEEIDNNEDVAESSKDVSGNTKSSLSNLANIKNGIENKDKNIPDVPPPPLPAGAKKVQKIIAL